MGLKMSPMIRILANDGIDEAGRKIFLDAGFEVVTEKVHQDSLSSGLAGFDAVLVRRQASCESFQTVLARRRACRDGFDTCLVRRRIFRTVGFYMVLVRTRV